MDDELKQKIKEVDLESILSSIEKGWSFPMDLRTPKMADIIKELTEREAKLVDLIKDMIEAIRHVSHMKFGDVPNRGNLDKYCNRVEATLKELGVK